MKLSAIVILLCVGAISIPAAVALPSEEPAEAPKSSPVTFPPAGPMYFPTASSPLFPSAFRHETFPNAEPITDFNGLKVRGDEIELLGYGLGYRNGYNAVEESVSGLYKSPETTRRFCSKSLEVDRLEFLETFKVTKPGNAFVKRLECGLVEGHEDGDKAGRKEEDYTPIGKYMTKLREGLLERAVYERAKAMGLGGKEAHRTTGFLRTQPIFFYRSASPPPAWSMQDRATLEGPRR